ncbi:MAG TPA: TetR/AcrR family transcriptional regulator [Pseudomonas xinjiangensis]|uniref:TetR/AcrR family transcriptional regulator n=2 Tax=root TaxID=1 RepID=A0A7V1FTK6_9GAMM|nr:TetR/AcrR family transcriptional regulator [Halopseudomonas xinjiangensis]HEC46061.1 TetR/AcrR family transcriptional regulator [Halopseudomonas xinjiangensis]
MTASLPQNHDEQIKHALDTPLSRRLKQDSSRATPADALAFALARFEAGERVDIKSLCTKLNVDRTTLFRWVGNRDQLLTEVMWTLSKRLLADIGTRNYSEKGGARIAMIVGDYAEALSSSEFFRKFVQREGEIALRILTKKSIIQQRLINRLEQLLQAEMQQGNLNPPMSCHDLAYVIVRIVEAFIYTDFITGEPAEPKKARLAISALLRD